ncbi:hypothetical protein [Parafrankia sp. EUN1f]|uniref:hypothetical protein n=1 Tax=Parafrankia sp. EUN1f TaxID=102897 RepID=UPI0001C45EBD|nr:hypothetical protein [Parafrankia sp. EUN1f]EFC81936.1 hypothetical protein FrEUN1fDRAFT_4951 [Parafrankia sp. EUN1f]
MRKTLVDWRLSAKIFTAAGLVAAFLTGVIACDNPVQSPPFATCELLTAEEVTRAVGAQFTEGQPFPGEGAPVVIGCPYGSPKGWVTVWATRENADSEYRHLRGLPYRQPTEDVSGSGYKAFTYTSGGNIQDFYAVKGGVYVNVTVGAGAEPGTARALGEIAVTRIS